MLYLGHPCFSSSMPPGDLAIHKALALVRKPHSWILFGHLFTNGVQYYYWTSGEARFEVMAAETPCFGLKAGLGHDRRNSAAVVCNPPWSRGLGGLNTACMKTKVTYGDTSPLKLPFFASGRGCAGIEESFCIRCLNLLENRVPAKAG